MKGKNILHVSPVMPEDERQIELALDTAGIPGTLVSNWVPSSWERALLRLMPPGSVFQRREPVGLLQRLHKRDLLPDIVRTYRVATGHCQVVSHDAFFRKVDESAAGLVTGDTSLVIGREFGCLRTFERA